MIGKGLGRQEEKADGRKGDNETAQFFSRD